MDLLWATGELLVVLVEGLSAVLAELLGSPFWLLRPILVVLVPLIRLLSPLTGLGLSIWITVRWDLTSILLSTILWLPSVLLLSAILLTSVLLPTIWIWLWLVASPLVGRLLTAIPITTLVRRRPVHCIV